MNKVNRVKTFLRSAAVADADHDFSGGRAGESTFKEIFKKHKDIGTPNPLPPEQQAIETPISEYQVLNMFLNFLKDSPQSEEISTFRNTFLIGEPGIPKEIMSFQRWKEDPIPYTVTSVHLGSKDDKKDYVWHMSSEDCYKFMNPHNQANAAFAVDAVSMPFYECLQNDKYDPSKTSYVVNYIISREAMNDAAGKISISEKQNEGKQVKINVKNDTNVTNILYPAIQMNAIEGLSELECFFSNYNLILGPVGQKKDAPVLTLSITDKQLSHQVQVMKHNKENAHPNSVPFLSKLIDKLKVWLFKSGNTKEKTMYNFALQQKRSGDWLQVLALLTPERFGLSPKDRIALVSLDKICVAYALFAGIDVFFTYFDVSTKKYWLVRFHKNYNTKPLTPSELLQNDVNAFLINADETGKPKIVDDQQTYDDYKATYNQGWNSVNQKLTEKLSASLESLNSFIVSDSFRAQLLDKPLKAALYDATTLAVFRSLAVKLLDTTDENVRIREPITEQNIESVRENFSSYKHNFMALKTALVAKKSSVSGSVAIAAYFSSIFIKNGAGTVAQQTRNDLIDNLVLFKSFFNKANGGANGIGIFTFLNEYLSNDEKTRIADIFEKPIEKIVDDKLKTMYKQFVGTVSLLTLEEADPVILEPLKGIPSSDLLESIEAVIQEPKEIQAVSTDQAKDDELIAMQEAAESLVNLQEQQQLMEKTDAAVQVPNNFQVTDFAAALALLSFKLQNCSEQVEDIKARASGFVGGASLKKAPIKIIHNPLTSFYFILREASFRLSSEDGKDKIEELVIFSQLIMQILSKKPRILNALQEYMYYINLENYFLENGSNFIMRDIANSVKQGYYGIETLPNLADSNFSPDLSKYPVQQINSMNMINNNLEFMKTIVNYVKTFETVIFKFTGGVSMRRKTLKKRSVSPRKTIKKRSAQTSLSSIKSIRTPSKTSSASAKSIRTPVKTQSPKKTMKKTATKIVRKSFGKTHKKTKRSGSYGKKSPKTIIV